MVHIGNNPPNLDEIAELLSSGDIITHCYNGKPNRILTPSGELRASISSALNLLTLPNNCACLGHIIPTFTNNLLSIGQLCDSGCTAHFDSH